MVEETPERIRAELARAICKASRAEVFKSPMDLAAFCMSEAGKWTSIRFSPWSIEYADPRPEPEPEPEPEPKSSMRETIEDAISRAERQRLRRQVQERLDRVLGPRFAWEAADPTDPLRAQLPWARLSLAEKNDYVVKAATLREVLQWIEE